MINLKNNVTKLTTEEIITLLGGEEQLFDRIPIIEKVEDEEYIFTPIFVDDDINIYIEVSEYK